MCDFECTREGERERESQKWVKFNVMLRCEVAETSWLLLLPFTAQKLRN